MTEYQRRPQRIEAIRVTDSNLAEAAELSGGAVNDDGVLIIPLYGEGSEIQVPLGAYVWADDSGPHMQTDAEQFAMDWAVASDGPTVAAAFGTAQVTIAPGETGTFGVPLSRTMPSDDYVPAVTLSASDTVLERIVLLGARAAGDRAVVVSVHNTSDTDAASALVNVIAVGPAT